MQKLDLNNITIQHSYNIPNTDCFFIDHTDDNIRNRHFLILDMNLNIIEDRDHYNKYLWGLPLDEEKYYVQYNVYMEVSLEYLQGLDILIITRSVRSMGNDYFCKRIFKVYEDKLLSCIEKNRGNVIMEYTNENISMYFNYKNIIVSLYLSIRIKCNSIEKYIENIGKISYDNTQEYEQFYKIINENTIFEFNIPEYDFGLNAIKYDIYFDTTLYKDYTYILFDLDNGNEYVIKIYPDFNESKTINISKLIQEKYSDNIYGYFIFILFNEIIIQTKLCNYKFNLTELFEDKEYINYRIHKISNTINKEDL